MVLGISIHDHLSFRGKDICSPSRKLVYKKTQSARVSGVFGYCDDPYAHSTFIRDILDIYRNPEETWKLLSKLRHCSQSVFDQCHAQILGVIVHDDPIKNPQQMRVHVVKSFSTIGYRTY